jgi:hypothetical protein
MTDINDGSITASKLKADELQIKLDEQVSPAETKPAETTNNLRVYQMNSKPQRILLWLIVIMTLLNISIFSSGIKCSGAILFVNLTRNNYSLNIAVPSN